MTKTPSYVLTFRLMTEIHQEHKLSKRFEIARNIYNACLGELYKRYAALKQSRTVSIERVNRLLQDFSVVS